MTTYDIPAVMQNPNQMRVDVYDYLTASEIKEILGVSRSKAYAIIHELNVELEGMGKIVLPGKVPKKLLLDHLYPQSVTA